MDKKRLFISGALAVLILSVPAFYLYKKNAPRRIAVEYLKAARQNDLDKLQKLSYPTHWGEIAARGVLVRPVSWKFIGENRVNLRKKEFDLTQAAYKKEVASALYLYNEPFVDKLPSETLKKRLASFGSWRSENVNTYGLFEVNGGYYYNDATPRIELLFNITEEPGKPPVEYMLAMEQKSSGNGRWEVTEFTKR